MLHLKLETGDVHKMKQAVRKKQETSIASGEKRMHKKNKPTDLATICGPSDQITAVEANLEFRKK